MREKRGGGEINTHLTDRGMDGLRDGGSDRLVWHPYRGMKKRAERQMMKERRGCWLREIASHSSVWHRGNGEKMERGRRRERDRERERQRQSHTVFAVVNIAKSLCPAHCPSVCGNTAPTICCHEHMSTQTHTHADKVLLAGYISSTKSYNKAHSHRSGLYKRSASDNHHCQHGVLCGVLMTEIWTPFICWT